MLMGNMVLEITVPTVPGTPGVGEAVRSNHDMHTVTETLTLPCRLLDSGQGRSGHAGQEGNPTSVDECAHSGSALGRC